jgi:outer membrane protein
MTRLASAPLVAMLWLAGVSAAVAAETPQIDLSLAQALKTAKHNNLDVAAAADDVRIAQARVLAAGAALLPTIGASYAYQHSQYPTDLTVPLPGPGASSIAIPLAATDTNAVSAILQYVVYDGGVNHATIGVAASNYSAAQSELSGVTQTVERDVTAAYFGLVQAREAIVVADEAQQVAQADVRTADELFAQGTVAKADVLRQELSLADAESRDIAAHNDVSLANAALANLLNIDLSSVIEPTESLDGENDELDLAHALEDARRNRPKLLAAESAVQIAKQTVALARSGNLPTIAVSAAESSVKPNFFGVPQPQLTATLSATWRLFDGGLTRARVGEAEAQIAKANVNLTALQNGVDLEVRQAYYRYIAARAALAPAGAAVSASAEVLRLSRLRFSNGVGTSLELADAALSDARARTGLIAARVTIRTTYAALVRATGGSRDEPATPATVRAAPME